MEMAVRLSPRRQSSWMTYSWLSSQRHSPHRAPAASARAPLPRCHPSHQLFLPPLVASAQHGLRPQPPPH